MNPKKSEQEKQNNLKSKNSGKTEEKEKKSKKEMKPKKEENKEEPGKKSKLKELLESKDDEKKEAKKPKLKSKKTKEKDPKQKITYTIEFIMKLKDEKAANEELLLSKDVKNHFEKFKKENVEIKKFKIEEKEKPELKEKSKSKKYDSKAEEEFKKVFNEALKDKKDDEKLYIYLDKINSDNYDFVKKEILELIKDSPELQDKFVDTVIKTSICKFPYCEIYAKLSKSLDKDLPKKGGEEDKKAENKKSSSEMKINLIDKTRLLFTSEKFEDNGKDEHQYEKDHKLKKNMFGITKFLIELIKVHILSKKVAASCFQSLFSRYEKNKNNETLKAIYIEAIIMFVEEFEKLIHSHESKMPEKEAEEYSEKVEEIIKKLEQIKDEVKERYLKNKIIKLIERRKKNYEKTKLEKYLEERLMKEPKAQEENKFAQEIINDRIEKGLNDYIEFVEKEGASDKYDWKDETFLIEKKGQGLDDILEAYFLSCGNIFEKDIQNTKNYIKELIEYYIGQKNEKEKTDLKNRLINAFDIVKNDMPIMNDIYSNTINMFLENKIMEIMDLESIGDELAKEELEVVDKIFKNLNEISGDKKMKEDMAKLKFISNNKDSFKWLFDDAKK